MKINTQSRWVEKLVYKMNKLWMVTLWFDGDGFVAGQEAREYGTSNYADDSWVCPQSVKTYMVNAYNAAR